MRRHLQGVRALLLALHRLRGLLRLSAPPRAEPLHLAVSVRPVSGDEAPAWAWALSDGTTGAGGPVAGRDVSPLGLEALALLDALKTLSLRRRRPPLVVHVLAEPFLALDPDGEEWAACFERHLRRPGRRPALETLAGVAGRMELRFVPAASCSCDRRRLLLAARRALPSVRRPLPTPAPGSLQVATDGSFNQFAQIGGWAWFVSGEHFEVGVTPAASSGEMELLAVVSALRSIPDQDLEVLSDCLPVVRGVNRAAAGRPVPAGAANRAAWVELQRLVSGRAVRATWVAAHRGHPTNTEADVRARAAMRAEVRRVLAAKDAVSALPDPA